MGKKGEKHGLLTIKQKAQLIQHDREEPGKTQKELAYWVKDQFGVTVNRSTISKILNRKKNKDEDDTETHPVITRSLHQPNSKRMSSVRFPEVEKELIKWILDYDGDASLTDDMIITHGKAIAECLQVDNLKFSNGWLHGFKRRHNLKSTRPTSGESAYIQVPPEEMVQQPSVDILESFQVFDIPSSNNSNNRELSQELTTHQILEQFRRRKGGKDKTISPEEAARCIDTLRVFYEQLEDIAGVDTKKAGKLVAALYIEHYKLMLGRKPRKKPPME